MAVAPVRDQAATTANHCQRQFIHPSGPPSRVTCPTGAPTTQGNTALQPGLVQVRWDSAREDRPPPGARAAAGGVVYFSCSRAAVRKMAPNRWVNSAWVVTSVVNQSSWLPSASFFSASTTDSSAAW